MLRPLIAWQIILLLSEVGVNTITEAGATQLGYAEVFNPTASNIALDNYYLSDYNATANKYYSIVTFNGAIDLGGTDYLVKFPAGTILQPGRVAVVTQDAVTFLGEFFGGDLNAFTSQPGSPQLFEVTDSNPLVPDMVNLNSNATTPGNFGKTNGSATNGEHMVLFYWDQSSDLVKDVDIIQWGNPTGGNAYTLKTSAITMDGPDVDATATAFKDDAGPVSKIAIATAPYDLLVRVSSDEAGETTTGGNGITGNDETTENVATSWASYTGMTLRSPGTSALASAGANATPQVTEIFRSILHPSSTSAITIEAGTSDADGSVVAAELILDAGAGFATVTMTQVNASTSFTATVGPFPNHTTIRYYVEVKDNSGASTTYPADAPTTHRRFLVDNEPVTDSDLVINEIMYNNIGAEAYEFVELFNRRSTPVELSGFGFGDNLTNIGYRIPEGTVLPGYGYLVLTLDKDAFETEFGVGTVPNLHDWGSFSLRRRRPVRA